MAVPGTVTTRHKLADLAQRFLAVLFSLLVLLPAVLAIYFLLFLAIVLCGRFMRIANSAPEYRPGALRGSATHHAGR